MGIGASAGGLQALTRLLGAVPADIGMAFFVVMHLNPKLPTALVNLLAAATRMRVVFAVDGAEPLPNVVYVAPPGRQLTLVGPLMRLSDEVGARPVDAFLESLAFSAGQRAIGVLLSGAGTDGTLGLTAIREAAGITLVQDGTATFPGMARAAVLANVVDRVVSPEEIAATLLSLRRNPYVRGELRLGDAAEHTGEEGALDPILDLLLARGAVDFRGYKPAALRRRILRRVALRSAASLEAYLQILRDEPAELHALCGDLLIKVTAFFRDSEVFDALGSTVLPRLLEDRDTSGPLRIWVVGCATGEEAYSIAMAVLECETATGRAATVQIFATDVSDAALSFARQGRYALARCVGVSEERLERFFVEVGDDRQIRQDVREMCVFARHDITTDPPFSKMDLVCCRNVLMYFGRHLQEQVLPTLHYALQPWGGLLVGRSESVGNSDDDLFEPDTLSIGFHARRGGSTNRLARLRMPEAAASASSLSHPRDRGTLGAQAERFLAREYSPPGVVVDGHLRVLQFLGDTSRFLINAPGAATLQVLEMVDPALRFSLSEAICSARQQSEPVRGEPIRVRGEHGSTWVVLLVVPLERADAGGSLVLFETSPRRPAEPKGLGAWARDWGRSMVEHLRHEEPELTRSADRRELESTRSQLQGLVEERASNVEELRTSTEELRSSNEELQCTNEELQTAREEVLATNEELTTVNEELELRNQTLARSHDDLTNLLASTALGIVVVDDDRRIRWVSPGAEASMKLQACDIGRPFEPKTSGLDLPPPEELVDFSALQKGPQQLVTRGPEGRWYSVGVRPYRRADGSMDGAVIAVVDVDELKRAEAELFGQRSAAQWIVDTVRQPLATIDQQLAVVSANPAFCAMLATTEAALRGMPVGALELGLETLAARKWLQAVADGDETVDDIEVVQTGNPARHLEIRVHRIAPEGAPSRLLVVVDDVTARRLWEKGEAEMVGRVLAAQADERESLARELHDETGQALSALIVGLRGVSEHIDQPEARALVDQLRERARELLDVVGRLARGLHPPSLDALGLEGAFTELAEDFSRTHAVAVDLQFLGDRDLSTVPKSIQLVVYRAAQEALTNVARHAAASMVAVHLTGAAHEVSLHVVDDGYGFTAPAPAPARGGIGLVLMRRRLAMVQGRVSLQSAPGEGTRLDITVPLEGSDG